MVLEPIELAVRIPIDDTIRVQHHPYITNLTNAELAIKMDKSVGKVVEMLDGIQPMCLKSLKKALKANSKLQNRYTMKPTKTF